ncbi:MAG TPA: Uma2 family endonuclease [Planctomycetaceae bacterium]|nr:Uma2 family endonuclease [Planctomycetaceae bacterium]
MATTSQFDSKSPNQEERVPFLENGDCLDGEEFLRRWEAMPEVKQAELVEGVVFMNAAQRFSYHGDQLLKIGYWLNSYVAETPGTHCGGDCTVQFEENCILQPDTCLFLSPELGGCCHINDEHFLEGSPELILEVSASSASRDLNQKKKIYEECGVREYVVWNVLASKFVWYRRQENQFVEISCDEQGCYRSQVFPGLWLNAIAMLAGDLKSVRDTVIQGLASSEHEQFIEKNSILIRDAKGKDQ